MLAECWDLEPPSGNGAKSGPWDLQKTPETAKNHKLSAEVATSGVPE